MNDAEKQLLREQLYKHIDDALEAIAQRTVDVLAERITR